MSQSNNPPKPLPYCPPVGPKGGTSGPGLGGTNHGNSGTQNGVSQTTTIPPGQTGPYGR